jgi:hypothetical protein
MYSYWLCSKALTAEYPESAEEVPNRASGIGNFAFLAGSAISAVKAYAFTTLPLRRQDVHTRIRLVVAPTRACTGRRFTFQRRLVTL